MNTKKVFNSGIIGSGIKGVQFNNKMKPSTIDSNQKIYEFTIDDIKNKKTIPISETMAVKIPNPNFNPLSSQMTNFGIENSNFIIQSTSAYLIFRKGSIEDDNSNQMGTHLTSSIHSVYWNGVDISHLVKIIFK